MDKKIRPEGRKMFLFYEKFLIELYRKTSGRMIVEAENSPKNFRSGDLARVGGLPETHNFFILA